MFGEIKRGEDSGARNGRPNSSSAAASWSLCDGGPCSAGPGPGAAAESVFARRNFACGRRFGGRWALTG